MSEPKDKTYREVCKLCYACVEHTPCNNMDTPCDFCDAIQEHIEGKVLEAQKQLINTWVNSVKREHEQYHSQAKHPDPAGYEHCAEDMCVRTDDLVKQLKDKGGSA